MSNSLFPKLTFAKPAPPPARTAWVIVPSGVRPADYAEEVERSENFPGFDMKVARDSDGYPKHYTYGISLPTNDIAVLEPTGAWNDPSFFPGTWRERVQEIERAYPMHQFVVVRYNPANLLVLLARAAAEKKPT